MKELLGLALVTVRHRPLEFGTCAINAQPTACAAGARRRGRNSRRGCRLSGRGLSCGQVASETSRSSLHSPNPDRILDPNRVLVTSTSNFGAPLALTGAPEGSVLSLDPDGATLAVPAAFAAVGDQAIALNGRVQLFTAQSPAFLNSVTTPAAASASRPAVSNPLGISINNAFGRLWFASAPSGASGEGLDSIIDPGGMPLAGAPSKLAGGVFAGATTNRPQQIITGGLTAGAVANAFVGMSPDGSKRAVFVVLTADGALAQAHAQIRGRRFGSGRHREPHSHRSCRRIAHYPCRHDLQLGSRPHPLYHRSRAERRHRFDANN